MCVAFGKKVMLWKFYDAHKEKIYQRKVRRKTCYEKSSGQMNDNDDA